MMRIVIVLAAVLLLAPASWAEEAPAAPAAVTTTTRPDRGHGSRAGEGNLPTGLPGFGTPGPPPATEEDKAKAAPRPPAGAP